MSSYPVRNLTILLVEDEPADVALLRRALGGQPFTELAVCEDGHAALAHLREHQPDLIILDLGLPGVDGFGVLDYLASRETPAPPVVVLTAADSEADRERAYGLHATTFLTKPDRPDDLVRVVRAINDFWIRMLLQGSEPA